MKTHKIGIIMNGVTGRMGHNQHLVRSIVAILRQGGVRLGSGDVILPDPILVGRSMDKLKPIAEGIGLSLPVMALAWCLKNEHVSTVILGASKEAQLQENLTAVAAQDKLTPAVLARIAKVIG